MYMRINKYLGFNMNKVLEEDINNFVNSFKFSDEFINSSILITGGTGLIGSTLVHCLLSLNKQIKIVLPVRDIVKAKSLFDDEYDKLVLVETDLISFLKNMEYDFQYIIHCASPTSGIYMKQYPVETYNFVTESTRLLLDYAKLHFVKSMVYLSSVEYYGELCGDDLIYEHSLGYIDSSNARSSYPIAKRSAEFMCISYALEYNVPVKIARLTQTFGPGIDICDNRVFAQFARSIINSQDIVLHTLGESAKPYCYTIDCVNAILYILLMGEIGAPYNVANESTYISIKDLAEFLCRNFGKQSKVCIDLHSNMGYAPTTKLRLSTCKLESLGWKPKYSLYEMFDRLITSMRKY